MKALLKIFFLQFILFYFIILPYSISIVSFAINSEQEVSYGISEYCLISQPSADTIFSEVSDDLEGLGVLCLSPLNFLSTHEFISINHYHEIYISMRMPFELFCIPPPTYI